MTCFREIERLALVELEFSCLFSVDHFFHIPRMLFIVRNTVVCSKLHVDILLGHINEGFSGRLLQKAYRALCRVKRGIPELELFHSID